MAEGSLPRNPETMETGHPPSGLQTVDDTAKERRHLLTQIDIPSFGAQLMPFVETTDGSFGGTGTLQSQQPGPEGSVGEAEQKANSESGVPGEKIDNETNGDTLVPGIPGESRLAEQSAISGQGSLVAQEGQVFCSWREKVTMEHRKTIVYNLVCSTDSMIAAMFCSLCGMACAHSSFGLLDYFYVCSSSSLLQFNVLNARNRPDRPINESKMLALCKQIEEIWYKKCDSMV